MANVVKHPFVSAVADGGDATKVRPSNWNAAHVFAGGTDNQVLIFKNAEPDKAAWLSLTDLAALILTTKGDLLARTTSGVVRKGVGTDGQVPIADSTIAEGWRWGVPTVSVPNVTITGTWGSRQFEAGPDGAAPTTNYVLTSSVVTLWKPSDKSIVVLSTPGVTVVNTATAGPVINGRDQAGAFPNSSWIHFYRRWNGTAIGGCASLNPPATGPNAITGYDWWAYDASVYKDANGNLVPTSYQNNRAWYHAEQVMAVGAGLNNVEEVIPLATVIPPNAMGIVVGTEIYSGAEAQFRIVGGAAAHWTTGANLGAASVHTTLTLPTFTTATQTLIYLQKSVNYRRLSALGFHVSNGAS